MKAVLLMTLAACLIAFAGCGQDRLLTPEPSETGDSMGEIQDEPAGRATEEAQDGGDCEGGAVKPPKDDVQLDPGAV